MGCLFSCFTEVPYYPRLYYDMTPIKAKPLPIIWLIGPPGSGRKVQGEQLAEFFDFDNIRVTQLLRDEATKDTDRGNIISGAIRNRLKKIPDTLVVDMLKEAMLKSVNNTKGYIINNFPKSSKQADLFVNEICDVDIVVHLQTDVNMLITRIQEKINGKISNSTLKMKIENCNKDIEDCLAKYKDKVFKINTDETATQVCERLREIISNNLAIVNNVSAITSELDYAENRNSD